MDIPERLAVGCETCGGSGRISVRDLRKGSDTFLQKVEVGCADCSFENTRNLLTHVVDELRRDVHEGLSSERIKKLLSVVEHWR